MKKSRIEAFTDAIVAIILTIMVLEIKVPEETS
jgi:Predicted integral membrane protein